MYFDKKPLLFPNKKIERKNAQNSKILWNILKKHFFFFTNLKSTCDDVISFAKLAKTSWRHFVWQAFYVYLLINFFYQGFLSQTLMIHRTAGEGRGPSFISLYYFYLLTNIETFICNFACDLNITYFKLKRLCLPNSVKFMTLSNDHFID